MPKFEQPIISSPERPGKEEKFEQSAADETLVFELKREKKEKEQEKPEKKRKHRRGKTKIAASFEISETEAEAKEAPTEAQVEEESQQPYSKEEWLEVVENLKEQAAIQRQKDKIEEEEEIIELTEEINGRGEERPEKGIFNLYKQIREARRELAEAETEWKLYGGDFEKYQKNQKTKEDYNELQRQLLERFLIKAEKRWGRNSEKFVEFKNRLIFKGFVGREQERFLKSKEDALPEKEKGRFRLLFEKVAQNYVKLPKVARWGIAAGLGTAVAFGTGGVAASALLGYAGFRYGRAALGSLSAVGAKALGDAAEKIWLEKYGKEAREEKLKSEIAKASSELLRNTADVEVMSRYLLKMKDLRNEELAKLIKRQKQWRVGKMAAMIGAGGGIAFWAGSLDAFTGETGVGRGIQERLGIEEGKPPIIYQKETPSVGVGPAEVPGKIEAEKFLAPESKAVAFIETAKPGDSVWRLAERQLENHGYFKNLSGSAEEIAAKKTFITDWVKDQVARNPEQFGLSDPDKIAIGQKIDLSPILSEKADELASQIEAAEKLSSASLTHINNNNELISQWLKNHPGERLTSDKVAEILGGKRLKILTSEKELMSWEDYTKKVPAEQLQIDLESWEDYTQKIPSLNEEELLELNDYYGEKSVEYNSLGDREAAEAAEALKQFHTDQLRIYNNITEILAPINMRPAEYLAIKNVTVGKFLEETAGGWEKWRSDEAITIDLPHDGVYGAGEYSRQLKLADFIKKTNPTQFDKSLTIEEYLKQFIKK